MLKDLKRKMLRDIQRVLSSIENAGKFWHSEQVMFVGDSLLDEKAAASAGVALVAYRNPELAGAIHVDDFNEFRRALGGFLE